MNDAIRLRGGNRAGMPALADREPAYVRDEQALYVGTPAGNVRLAAAGTEGRVRALEDTAAAQSAALTSHAETLDSHGTRLTACENTLKTHGGTLDSHSGTLNTHGTRLTACENTLNTHGELLDSHDAALAAHGSALENHSELLDSHSELLEGMEGVQQTHTEQLTACSGTLASHTETLDAHTSAIGRLETDKLTAVPAAALTPLAADADAAAVAAAYNRLLTALQAAGIMQA